MPFSDSFLRSFVPSRAAPGHRERLRAAIGALAGLLVTGALATSTMGGAAPALIAPMGASAVLLFAVPASPLAQPWSIVGGNLVAALIGVTVARWVPSPLVAAGFAAALAILAMAALRCIHPPSGAVALTAVLGGPHVVEAGYHFVLTPVLLDSVLLATAAIAWNNLTGLSYPHRAHPPAHPHPPRATAMPDDADFDAVLADYGEALDIDREDLKMLVRELVGRVEERNVRS